MPSLVVSPVELTENPVEVVERKGLGHPDTICDALAEALSQNLCREYRRLFGQILHHNVDKALLCGGQAKPAFRGGSVTAPITIYLAGRAISQVGGEIVRIQELAIEGSRLWLSHNLHALDVERHVKIHALVQPGSQDLQELFARGKAHDTPLANDTSIGVGFAPLTRLEQLVLALEKHINGRTQDQRPPAWGEDVKVMGVRFGKTVRLTIACAMIGQHLADTNDYLAQKAAIQKISIELALQHGFETHEVAVNAADDPSAGAVYLTVTGTSAEAGDDGQVGRGNRVNGLITPGRPMSLEAAAGKNPVSHVGKIYNVLAKKISQRLIGEIPEITTAECLMVSQIGSPITKPSLIQMKVSTRDGFPIEPLRSQIEAIAEDTITSAAKLVDDFTAGLIDIF